MGKASRDKGNRVELEIAKIMGARKISGFQRPGPDLVWRGLYVEVKARREGWTTLYRLLEDDSSILVLKADRKDPLVTLRLADFLDLVGDE